MIRWRENAYFTLHAKHKLCTTLAPHTCFSFLIPRIFYLLVPYGVAACVCDVAVLMCNYDSKTVIFCKFIFERTEHTAKSEIH